MAAHSILLPTVHEYVAAFRAVEDRITPNQRRMLEFHHAQPARAVSATTLAAHVGWSSYSPANLHYGKLGYLLSHELGIDLSGDASVGVLVSFVAPEQAANAQYLWILRENVALALEELQWVPRVSQCLYPDLALNRLRPPVGGTGTPPKLPRTSRAVKTLRKPGR